MGWPSPAATRSSGNSKDAAGYWASSCGTSTSGESKDKGPLGRVGFSREKVAKQEGPHLNTNRCPERRAAGQKETAKRLEKELKRTRKKKRGTPPPETGRAAQTPSACHLPVRYEVLVLRDLDGAVGAFAGDATSVGCFKFFGSRSAHFY